MESFGSGVEYVSPDACNIVGIGGLSALGPDRVSLLLGNEKLGLPFLRLLNDMLPRSLRAAGNAWIDGGWESFAAVSGWPNVLDGAESLLDDSSLIMRLEEGEKLW